MSILIPVTTYYLEMTDRREFQPKYLATSTENTRLQRIEAPDPHLNRQMYIDVGRDYVWIDRLVWSLEQWAKYVNRPVLETNQLLVEDEPAGYFELEQQANGSVELAYFGLLPKFVGRGLGSHLLSLAIARAWELPVQRVWVHTCTLDHRHALKNYLSRGFRLYKTEIKEEQVEEIPPDSPAADGL